MNGRTVLAACPFIAVISQPATRSMQNSYIEKKYL
jgi:hypothetical protein